jgi:integrase
VDETVDEDMPKRIIGRLTELQVRRLGPGKYCDGGGLWLRVEDKHRRWWFFRYSKDGRQRARGVGPTHTVSLADAREQARACRQMLLRGEDPIAAGKARRTAIAKETANAKTFTECANVYWESHRAGWSSKRHAHEWKRSLETYVLPMLGDLPVAAIDTAQVLRVLEPMWTSIPETASRVRGRIETVLDWAKTRNYRDGENPARWRGHLKHLLPSHRKVAQRGHHPAMPYSRVPDFMRELRQPSRQGDPEARALEFIILTCARECELVGADWQEIDQSDGHNWIWVVPPEKMKARRAHRVPLSAAARALLERTPRQRRHGVIFAGKRGRPVSAHLVWRYLRGMTDTATVHGFRASFRTWAAEETNFAWEIGELTLAHQVSDETEKAYQRGELMRKRRQLAEAWARYLSTEPAKAAAPIPIRA